MESKKIVNKAVEVYIIATIIYSFIGRVVPFKVFIGEEINTIMYYLLALVGGGLVAVDFFTTKEWRKGKYIGILYIFIAVMCISSVLNIEYGYIDNVKTIIWTTIEIVLIYTLYKRYEKESFVKLMDKIWWGISAFWFFPVVYSLKQFALLERYRVRLEGTRRVRQGFYENRLFGIFNDPNFAAATSVYVILACLYLYKKSDNKKLKIFLIIDIIVQMMYVVLSGSRTAIVCMIAVGCVWGWLQWHKKNTGWKIGKKILRFVAVPVFSAVIVALGSTAIQKASIIMPMTYYYVVYGETLDEIEIAGEEIDDDLTTRKDGQGENISNNRTTIWKAYLDGMEGDLLFGGSPRNNLVKWQEKDPDGYLVETEYETHNGYLLVLVSTGVVGFSVLLVYVILYARKLWIYVKERKELETEFVFVMLLLITLLVYAFFFTEIFFIHNLTSVLFWMHLGASMFWIDHDQREMKEIN